MKKFVSLILILLVSVSFAELVGYESFDYPDGSDLVGQNGGIGWDRTQTGTKSTWKTDWGTLTNAVVNGGVYSSPAYGGSGGGAYRDWSSGDIWAGAQQAGGIIYTGATITLTDYSDWGGISFMADTGGEKVKYGLPYQETGVKYWGVSVEGDGGGNAFSNVEVELNVPVRIVGVWDMETENVGVWVNPDAEDYYNSASDNTADAFMDASAREGDWITGIRIACMETAEWDDVVVATTFEETFTFEQKLTRANNPAPFNGETGVLVNTDLTWDFALSSPGLSDVDQTVDEYEIYMNTVEGDPNLFLVDTIAKPAGGWDETSGAYSYTPAESLDMDRIYKWRVDAVRGSETTTGFTWQFQTKKSIPEILSQTEYVLADIGETVSMEVEVSSISPETYQWYKADAAGELQEISGEKSSVLEIMDVQSSDETEYVCKVGNDSGTEVSSEPIPLYIKKKIAYWPFDGGDYQSTVAGSPVSYLFGDPNFAPGWSGQAINFNGQDNALYTDIEEVDYFDQCNYNMTVTFWAKSSTPSDWNPFVARNGESSEGWQVRKYNTADQGSKICFTTRGTGGEEDGTPSERNIFDGQWHWVAATFDDGIKKLYIDGTLASEDTLPGGVIADTDSPVSMGARFELDEGVVVPQEFSFMGSILDEVSIYNYPIAQSDIAQMMADMTGEPVCQSDPQMDFDGDCKVSLSDFEEFASHWLIDNNVYPTE
ncbi:LamG-like jellyroll fold domain-containing protein [Sedimentisphaera salicampi]|uniref:Immunoglobulin I-set domain protein n=1 Tax=Sedimentisphaera salicampi TaxID=1941349 RepID=A0A1W6LJL7_9BACT|nr:LamG-like jellyroll fold domain-containing protein [Sedimentisphaera salicampi]ARN55959.1 Immunoglobulin I-set domain protein [Sedimentisphaera salicampi]OXU15875.1 Immunoglobulin I-set domain protein [Sedimentisphaera salicampi]